MRKTAPQWNQGKKEKQDLGGTQPLSQKPSPLQLYSMKGPINMTPESAVESIALDCQTNFVSASELDSSMLNKLALEAYNKVLSDFNRQKAMRDPGANMEQKILEGVGKIVMEFEKKRMNPYQPKFS